MTRLLNRPASTISRELRSNAAAGSYAGGPAQQACGHRRLQGRPLRKLHVDSILFGAVEHFMRLHWLPEQIACALARLYPQGHDYRVPLSKGTDRRWQIPDMRSIHLRPPATEDRQFPWPLVGDLIKGEANASAVGTLVECSSRLLMLVKLPHPKPLARPMFCKSSRTSSTVLPSRCDAT